MRKRGDGINHLDRMPIPDGMQIHEKWLEVAGVEHRREDAIAFCDGRDPHLEWEREPGNPHDKNAIQIFGCWRTLFGSRRRLIGYVPRDAAAQIAHAGDFTQLLPRLLRTYVGHDKYVEVRFQIIGPKRPAARRTAKSG